MELSTVRPSAVQRGVEKAERRLAVQKQVVIQQRDDARRSLYAGGQERASARAQLQRESRRRRTGTAPLMLSMSSIYPVEDETEVQRLQGDVGKAAAHSAAHATK